MYCTGHEGSVGERQNYAVIWSQKKSFRHNLNDTSNRKTSLTKVVTFDIQMDNM